MRTDGAILVSKLESFFDFLIGLARLSNSVAGVTILGETRLVTTSGPLLTIREEIVDLFAVNFDDLKGDGRLAKRIFGVLSDDFENTIARTRNDTELLGVGR